MIYQVLLFIVLTALTQVGGVVYLAAHWISSVAIRRLDVGQGQRWLTLFASFAVIYLVVSIYLLPPFAAGLGRAPLPCAQQGQLTVAPLTRATCLLNRHYASQPVHELLAELGRHMASTHPGTVVAYLDAGFALVDGFPLLPHLSHDDGHKVDLAFFYRNAQGRYQPLRTPSPIGYWAFEQPNSGDLQPCAGRSDLATLRWDMAYLQPYMARFELDEHRTGDMLRWLGENAARLGVERILLEPHLTRRFGLPASVFRFQGCRPARHDDHVHISLRPVHR